MTLDGSTATCGRPRRRRLAATGITIAKIMFAKIYKAKRTIHEGAASMPTINPYINFNGNAEEAFNFYKSVFGGEFKAVVHFRDLENPGFHIADNDADKIMRIVLPIGGNTLIANDVPESLGPVSENENRSKIAITAETKEEADKLFNGLSEGGAVEMPMAESPWGTYFAMFRDKYGIEWTVEFGSNGEMQP